MKIPITKIVPNPDQPRTFFDQAELETLAGTIRKHGVIQAISVEQADDYYILVDGERRWQLVEQIFGREAAANRGNNNSYDRRIREAIAKWRDTDLIVSSSSSAGYYLAADMNDVEVIAQEYVERSRKMEEKARNLRRRGAEAFGPQMPLL